LHPRSRIASVCCNKDTAENLYYIDNNLVEEELVFSPEEYLYSSVKDYAGERGLLAGIVKLL
jgi:hypothetical protein